MNVVPRVTTITDSTVALPPPSIPHNYDHFGNEPSKQPNTGSGSLVFETKIKIIDILQVRYLYVCNIFLFIHLFKKKKKKNLKHTLSLFCFVNLLFIIIHVCCLITDQCCVP